MKHMWISITEILPTRGKEYKVKGSIKIRNGTRR
jgi:hypothetical protein